MIHRLKKILWTYKWGHRDRQPENEYHEEPSEFDVYKHTRARTLESLL